MSIFGYDFKFKTDLDYMTKAETTHFRKMIQAGEVTHFRMTQCDNCAAFIPKIKKYCCKKCKEEKEGKNVTERMDG